MIRDNRKRPRKKGRKSKKPGYINIKKICILAALFVVLILSVCVLGYVIFFRTILAQEILPALRRAIVFEEPAPSVHLEPLEPEGSSQVTAPVESTVLVKALVESAELAEPSEAVVKDVTARKHQLPKVAIIIDDMGYDEAAGQKLLTLPIELTYSFLPFAPHTKKLQSIALRTGKTIFLHLPLQPKGTLYSPGPGALYLDDSAELQRMKLKKCLQEVPHAVGVNNHMGSSFTEDEGAMANIIQELKARSLIFVDSVTSPGSVAFQAARAAALQSARRNVFLDNIQDERVICGQLEKLVEIAEKKGWAIGIAHPYPATVNAIARCSGKYQARVDYVGVPEVLQGDNLEPALRRSPTIVQRGGRDARSSP